MQQRVGVAAAMLLKPKILLADEPTSALDVSIQKQVVEQMKMIREQYGTTILIVTHNIGVIRANGGLHAGSERWKNGRIRKDAGGTESSAVGLYKAITCSDSCSSEVKMEPLLQIFASD